MRNRRRERRGIYLDLLALFIVFIAFLWIPFWVVKTYIDTHPTIDPDINQECSYMVASFEGGEGER